MSPGWTQGVLRCLTFCWLRETHCTRLLEKQMICFFALNVDHLQLHTFSVHAFGGTHHYQICSNHSLAMCPVIILRSYQGSQFFADLKRNSLCMFALGSMCAIDPSCTLLLVKLGHSGILILVFCSVYF